MIKLKVQLDPYALAAINMNREINVTDIVKQGFVAGFNSVDGLDVDEAFEEWLNKAGE